MAFLAPFLNLAAALAVSALMFAAIGIPPWDAIATIVSGAFGSLDGIGYTLFYTTDFILAGLAVGIPYRAGLFNIGGEGQATLGGLAVGLVCLAVPGWPWWAVLPLAVAGAVLFGALWALVPALLQVGGRGNLVITTIMFNFLASALMTWLLVDVIRAPGDPSPETIAFDPAASLPALIAGTPVNAVLALALILAGLAWLGLQRTVWGYELRTVGESPEAARYAAIPAGRTILAAICLGGACAGLVGVNELMGSQHRLELGFTAGVGFIGIAVALMGRGHPLGVVPAALLFGALYQGGAELAIDSPKVTQDAVMAMNGLVILFCGALEQLWRKRRQ